MMKRTPLFGLLALLVACILALGLCAPALAEDEGTQVLTADNALDGAAEEDADPAAAEATEEPAEASQEPLTDDTVLATVNGVDVTYAQVRNYYESMIAQYGSMLDVSDPEIASLIKELAINYAVTEQVLMQKAGETGADQFTDEELLNIQQAADDTYQNMLDQYKAMFAEQGASEEQQTEAAEAFLASNSYTRDDVLNQLKLNELYTRLMNAVTGDLTVEEEQVRTAFDEKVQAAQQAYEQDKAQYDTDNMSGSTVYYVPEGVRAVKHILVMMDQTDAAELKSLRTQLEELPEDDPQREEVQGKADAIMETVQPKLDEIMGKIASGEDFQALIDEYGEDPGMQPGSSYRDRGYYLSEATQVYETPFTQAALAIERVGEVSEPVLGSRGFHIIRYDHDVASGPVDYALVKDELKASELATLQQQAEANALAEWTEAATIELFTERFTE